jgi:hypothetical protein
MWNRTVALGLVLLTFLAHPSVTLAQRAAGPHEWSIVKAVPPGDELVVKLKSGKTIKGRLRAVSDIHLSLARGENVMELDQKDVQKIQRIVPKSAAKPTLIGAGTGAAIALAGVGVAAAADDTGGSEGELAAAATGIALLGAGVGALVGLVFGSRQKKVLIYESL